ncbi:hypothetical protein [Maribacter sp. 2307ULW6-5]
MDNRTFEKNKAHWQTNSTPEFYVCQGSDVQLVVYRGEGIVFKRIVLD